uniref:Uncharacterized protein n=2 Tax=Anthoceros TaxID=3233 RepID=A0A6M8AVS1_ANTPU|nr:hypothetical protein [Anthoceros punctatus]YP_009863163.1 hypothetical protein [Anthoceros agrestis]QKD76577.1 hypothetical protein [Anthoceros punctatus]QKD76619.1 hypothetical protein [Anthoceros agrestis]
MIMPHYFAEHELRLALRLFPFSVSRENKKSKPDTKVSSKCRKLSFRLPVVSLSTPKGQGASTWLGLESESGASRSYTFFSFFPGRAILCETSIEVITN